MRIHLWVKISILFLLISTLLGAFLRYMFVDPIPGVNIRYIVHTHSHIAFLGWIFNALYAALLYSFFPPDFQHYKKYNILFICFVASVIGMMFSFPFQGYAAVSITFSTIHVFLSWLFAYYFIKDTLQLYKNKKPLSLRFAYWSLVFLVISSLGPFVLGYLMANKVQGPYADLAIYFYLHLQYDGWFTFAIFALIYHFLESKNILFNQRAGTIFLWIFALCCIPTYANSTLWASPPSFMYVVALVASFIQLFGIFYFIKSIRGVMVEIKSVLNNGVLCFIGFALFCFIAKNIFQLIGAAPELATMAYTIRNFLLAYLHLIFIGFVTIFLLTWLRQFSFWDVPSKFLWMFIVSFIVSEALLVAQPLLIMNFDIVIPHYFLILFVVSSLMPLSLLFALLPVKNSVQE